MPKLHELQAAFVSAMFEAEPPAVLACVDTGKLSPQARLAVYRNNIFHNFREALRGVYPVVDRLVGDEFFRFASERYIPRHDSRHGNLHRFGESFGEFLDGFSPVAGLPYLGDVARLEWCVHEVFHAGDRLALPADRLTSVASSQLPALVFTLNPACRLFASRFPVHRIWQANQGAAADETIDMDVGGVCLLIRRRAGVVNMEPLEAAQFALLSALSAGLPLQRALEPILVASAEFDFAAFLRQRIGDATIVDCAPGAS